MTLKEDHFSKFYDPTACDECLSFDYWHSIKQLHLEREAFFHARKAISDKNNPLALLRLGRIYEFGIGTLMNYTMAHYFYRQALSHGCPQAEEYIIREYTEGTRSLLADFEADKGEADQPSPSTLSWYKKILEEERKQKNYALLSQMRQYIPLFYPDYDSKDAIIDILNHRDTYKVDIYYALSTIDNTEERNHEAREQFMQQLCKPLIDEPGLSQRIDAVSPKEWLGKDEGEFFQAYFNFVLSYMNICEQNDVAEQDIIAANDMTIFPYIPMATLSSLRRQMVNCLLSVVDVDPLVRSEYITNLNSDTHLLEVSEKIRDKELQLFLVSFIELNLDIEILQQRQRILYNAYHRGVFAPLCTFLNDLAQSFSEAGIPHHLPEFTPANLPEIKLDV